MTFHGTGMDYYSEIWNEIREKNEDYSMSKRDIMDSYSEDDRIYQYDYPAVFTLAQESDNPYDPNAVAILADGRVCGYIKKGAASQVKNLLAAGKQYTIEAYGGKYKIVKAETDKEYVETGEHSLRIDVTFKESQTVLEPVKKKRGIPVWVFILVWIIVILLMLKACGAI